ncbi:hypothetical protein ACFWCA_08785 [Streptomyces phaeochromogenes]|uniref:Secreted protein n=1 Tax=Streptomyces phaeochromogenes TaxID=1923 RepID=A0ABZ1H8V5_STRPH|nr:hypothetical protein [Streptomyces phaeochromogenes]WRZ28447.1 hypothetical protein OG931_12125 [Streptomyces phaeochromogenes]WSD14027.1 hypothetical protein OHB35_12680 [Streptomyces phaeochromogenes]WSJ09035.1 hypothetical protein OG437_38120 [Streptomyces phaeochromogenes]
MTYRGRHRRRTKGRVLRAALSGTALALTAAATIISTSQAAGSDNPGPLTSITSSSEVNKLQLHENLVSGTTLDTLQSGMGGNVGVGAVLDSANHPMRNKAECDATESAALPVEPTATRAYCWDSGDATTQKWLPQSVTTSGDADNDGKWGPDRVILAGWTHNDHKAGEPADDKGLARIAFIDANDPDNLKYRWVLLVAPLSGGNDFGAVRSHVGGMVWYQDKLIVTAKNGADHNNALFVFDMNSILRADVNSTEIGKVSGGWSARGYQYVMPAIGSYNLTGGACSASNDNAVPCFGSISLDRTSTPDSLVANEWFSSGGSEPARVWRYYYSTASDRTGLLGSNASDNVNADEAYETKAVGLQGVLSHKPSGASKADWYTGYAPGTRDRHGTLWRQNESTAKATKCGGGGSYACWGQHTESLSYWQETGELWTLTEWAANKDNEWEPPVIPERVLYAVPLSEVDGSVE